ncbi:hypothetical protein N8772_02240 [Rickettsiales bacterium]|nr:hypothetical protein [Rickettsiales bacterium]
MNFLKESLSDSLQQIEIILDIVDDLDPKIREKFYVKQKIGQHLRHIFDHLIILYDGMDLNILDYNKRNRHNIIETDPKLARKKLNELYNSLKIMPITDRDINIISEISVDNKINLQIKSNLKREILYIINHTIHHLAHIKIIAQFMDIKLPEKIGLAPATSSYNRLCAH